MRRVSPRSTLPKNFGLLVDVEADRLRHADLAAMTPRELWAEAAAAEAELAWRIVRRERDVFVGRDEYGDWLTAEAWLTERIRRAKAGLKRTKAA